MRRLILYKFCTLLLLLAFCSCATLFNSKKAHVSVLTSEPCYMALGKDTLLNFTDRRFVAVERSRGPLLITAFTHQSAKTVAVKSRNSFAYWLNAYPNWHLWTGFYIDTKTKKRFTYPGTIYIDFGSADSSYLTYKPLNEPFSQYSNILKISPLMLGGFFNAAVEISYERRTGKSFSTQLTASYLLPLAFWFDYRPDLKGFCVAAEEKYYYRGSALHGPYVGLEVKYLKSQYTDIWTFGIRDPLLDTTYNYTNYLDTFGIKKFIFTFNLKLGKQIVINRFAVDLCAGLGLRLRDVTHFDRIDPSGEMERPRHPNLYYSNNRDGRFWTISIPLNVRIGWAF